MEVKLKVKRFDPEAGQEPELPAATRVDMPESATVLDALIEVREYQDGTLSLRCSCRSAICGSCAMRINGRARLACKTQVGTIADEGDEITGRADRQHAGDQGPRRRHGAVLGQGPRRQALAAARRARRRSASTSSRTRRWRPGRDDELHHVRRLRLRLHGAGGRQDLPRARRRWRRPTASSATRATTHDAGAPARAAASRAASGTARAATCASRSAPRT